MCGNAVGNIPKNGKRTELLVLIIVLVVCFVGILFFVWKKTRRWNDSPWYDYGVVDTAEYCYEVVDAVEYCQH